MSKVYPYVPNPSKTGEYTELREKCLKLIDCGFKTKALIELSGVPYNSVYDWISRGRNLNHDHAIKIEESLGVLRNKVLEAIG